MARASILTIEPVERGGVPVMMNVMYGLLEAAGHDPHLVYVDAERVPTERSELPGYFRARWRPAWEMRRGMRGLAIPRYPLPLWASWYAPGLFAPQQLAADIRVLVAGSAHFGLPYTLSGKPFVAWIATLYTDELRARAQAGDRWAEQVLDSPAWPRLQRQEARVLRRAARIIGISPYTAQRIREVYPELAGRVEMVLVPIDLEVFHPGLDSAAAENASPYLLLTARIVDPRKNTAMLFRAYARVRALRPDVRLVITGDLPDERIRGEAAEAGVAGMVEFAGHQSREALVRLIRGASVFVLSSNQEGLSISSMEALACGVPVVSTRCGGPEGLVADGETGYLVPVDDDVALADRILALLNDPAQRARMGAAAAAYAHAHFGADVSAARLRQVLLGVYPQYFEERG